MEIEVLAPAGSLESLVAAVNAGADAIYIGGQKFGARAYAKNPQEDALLQGIVYAHHFGVKVYMTLNTLLKEDEIKDLCEYVRPYYEAGVDALIVQDLGVMDVLMTYFPDVDIHASTQMSIMGHASAAKLYQMGVRRVVLAREASFSEIQKIRKSSEIEIEGFIHGALCYSYSGQCFMSSLIGGRSANRGKCAGTCRLGFEAIKNGKRLNKRDENYLLSCKDLCSLDILPDVLLAGVDSLKIEGRMKSPRYTAGVVRIWRKYVDLYQKVGAEGYRVEQKDRKELLDLYDRGGQTDGYYASHNGKDMLTLKEKLIRKESNDALFAFLDETYVYTQKKHRIRGKMVLRQQEPIALTLTLREKLRNQKTLDLEMQIFADAPSLAIKNAATKQDITKQMLKTGNTLYVFEELDVEMDSDLFVPVKVLNDLRRRALEQMDAAILGEYRRTGSPVAPDLETDRQENLGNNALSTYRKNVFADGMDTGVNPLHTLHLCVETREQLDGCFTVLNTYELQESGLDWKISFEADTILPTQWQETVEKLHAFGAKVFLYMPHIFQTKAQDFFAKHQKELQEGGFDGFLVRSLEESEYLKRIFVDAGRGMPNLHFDYNLYAYNTHAQRMNRRLGANMQTYSIELNLKELQALDKEEMEAIGYGRLPMMVSAQCIKKTTKGCDFVPEVLYLKDRQQEKMPVKNKCTFCYNHIYNAKPLSTLGISNSIRRLHPKSLRLIFTTESKEELLRITRSYVDVYFRNRSVEENMDLYTRGHYKRGID